MQANMSGEQSRHPYGFPFPPYPVQQELMDAISAAIDSRAVALFESPTGTGKTLSVICSTMTWLHEHRLDPSALEPASSVSCRDYRIPETAAGDEPDWVSAQASMKGEMRLRAIQDKRGEEFAVRARSARTGKKKKGVGSRGVKARRLGGGEGNSAANRARAKKDDDSTFLINDDGTSASSIIVNQDRRIVVSSAVPQVSDDSSGEEVTTRPSSNRVFSMKSDLVGEGDGASDISPDTAPRLRLLFATRTHSQLSQFLNEVRRTKFGASALTLADGPVASSGCGSLYPPLSVVTFGSRKVMCVNESVRSLPTSGAVSERCRELLGTGSKQSKAGGVSGSKRSRREEGAPGATGGCAFKNEDVERTMRDLAIVQMQDVEEITDLGTSLGGCPYFASRAAISSGAVDVIGVPYPALLHKQTRESLGITIDNRTIIVFDEAHNLIDAVNDIHAASLSRFDLQVTQSALGAYLERYRARLAPGTLFSVNQIMYLVEGLISCLPLVSDTPVGAEQGQSRKSRVVTPSSLAFEAKIDNLNIFQLSAFLRKSRLCHKLLGFIDAGWGDSGASSLQSSTERFRNISAAAADLSNPQEVELFRRRSRRGIASFESFLAALNGATGDCRVAIYTQTVESSCATDESGGRLKFFVLNPGGMFSSAIEEARSVILVGGTLSPRKAIKDSLLRELPKSRPVHEFECDHVIPQDNLGTFIVQSGPSGETLEFTRHTRNHSGVIDDLGRTVLKVARSSPAGVAVFFASYAFMSTVLARWGQNGCIEALKAVKPLFHETRGNTGVFESYAAAIEENKKRGALLTAVLGGRLSEGINFSDELGRVVMIVGMPFANAGDIETAELLRTMPDTSHRSEHLENSCMTIVNQAIGRAIRHRNDFAAVLLCDRRFARRGTVAKLPRYVRQTAKGLAREADLELVLKNFFKGK